ncbi:MAG: glycosyltransferase family 4 protein [Limisphaerales bacterium]
MVKALYYSFFPAGGIGRYAHEMLTQMSRLEGVEAELVCSPEYHWKDCGQYAVWPQLMSLLHRYPAVRKARFLTAQLVSPRRLCRRVRERQANVVHFNNVNHLTFPWWGPRLRRTGARMFITAHDVRRSKAILYRPWEERQLRAVYRSMSGVFVHSESQREELMEFAGVDRERIHIVPFGTMPYGPPVHDQAEARKKLDLPADRLIALIFGNIRDDKNIDAYLRAMASLKDRPFLVLAGRAGGADNKPDAYYRKLIEDLSLTEDVRFMNEYIADEDVADLFGASDFSVLPYRRSFNSQSATLNVATYYRRPVLVSDCPTVAATVRETEIGIIADGDGVSELAGATEEMMRALRSRRTFALEAYQERYSWSENARQSLAAYHVALEEPR